MKCNLNDMQMKEHMEVHGAHGMVASKIQHI